MSITTEIETLKTNLTNAYTSISTKGGTIPTNKNTENLETAINSISSYENSLRDMISNRKGMTSVDFPSGITSIGNYAFIQCRSLALTSLPSGITSIGNYAFNGCTKLALTSLPSGITSIGNYAFNYCTSLALTSLPNGITSIGSSAFSNCTSLTSLRIGSNIQTIASDAFNGCTNLTTIYINLPRTTVETMSGYSSKWGATNATIICNDDTGWVEA